MFTKKLEIFFVVFAILNVLLQLSGVLTIALPKEKDELADEELTKQIEELSKHRVTNKQIESLYQLVLNSKTTAFD